MCGFPLGSAVARKTSPVLFGNVVIVQADEEEGKDSFIVGLDKKTGKEVWRSPRKVQASWATPLLINTGKRTELIASGTESVIAYDPATGKELWRSKGLESNAIPSPVATAGHDMVVVSARAGTSWPASRAELSRS